MAPIPDLASDRQSVLDANFPALAARPDSDVAGGLGQLGSSRRANGLHVGFADGVESPSAQGGGVAAADGDLQALSKMCT